MASTFTNKTFGMIRYVDSFHPHDMSNLLSVSGTFWKAYFLGVALDFTKYIGPMVSTPS